MNKFFNLIKTIVPQKWHWIFEHEGYKRYFANTSWMFGGHAVSLLMSFFIGAWVARYLGPENYGILNYAIAFVGIFSFIASLGIDSILAKNLVLCKDNSNKLLGTAFRLKLFGGTISLVLAISSVFIFEKDVLVRILVSLFSFSFVLQSFNIIGNYFNSNVQSKYGVWAATFAAIVSSILKISIIVFGGGVIWFVSVFMLDVLWQGIGFIYFYKKNGQSITKWVYDKNLAKEIFKSSWPLMFAGAASFIYLKIDQVMIGAMLGNMEVGIYAAAVKLVEVWYFIPSIICVSLFPAIINAKNTDETLYKSRLRNFYILLFLISILIAIPITFLARPIVYMLFGGSFISAVDILQIYIWSSTGLFVGWGMNQYLISENLVNIMFWFNFISMIVNIILNFILIPRFGIIGSAWATLISYTVPTVCMFIFNKRQYE